MQWDAAYYARLAYCKQRYAPQTQGAEDCFRAWYDADAKIAVSVRAAVAALRAYWVARAAGESPNWLTTQAQVAQLIADLPPLTRQYFERVRGLQ